MDIDTKMKIALLAVVLAVNVALILGGIISPMDGIGGTVH